LLSLVSFAVFYGLADRAAPRRADTRALDALHCLPAGHARHGSPHRRALPPLVGMVPRIDGSPILPTVGFVFADLVLVALSWWDWRANRRRDVFPVALGVLLVYHVGTLTLHRVPLWNAFCVWFLGLPLS
jgi:hypothetical protein